MFKLERVNCIYKLKAYILDLTMILQQKHADFEYYIINYPPNTFWFVNLFSLSLLLHAPSLRSLFFLYKQTTYKQLALEASKN